VSYVLLSIESCFKFNTFCHLLAIITSVNDATLNEPFRGPRNPGRLLFDFGVIVSLLNYGFTVKPILDFRAGIG
jgi:hypothetical protein